MQQLTPVTLSPLAVGPVEGAELLGVSERHFRSMHSAGRLPKPVYIGRSPRWPVVELHAWLLAGSPNRERWETIRGDYLGLPG